MHLQVYRPAVAMIELIFSIVVMGIALMSAPMLLSTASSSIDVALQQEGINEASSRVSMILTYPWDQNNTDDSVCIPSVLHVTSGDTELDEVGSTLRRVGIPPQSIYRTFKCGTSELNATAIGKEGNTTDDIDDFSGTTISLVLDSSGSGGTDYLEQSSVNIATTVSYITDNASYGSATLTYTPGAAAGGTSNIKQIEVTLTSTNTADELKKNIKLKAFSCNIGGYDYESRPIP